MPKGVFVYTKAERDRLLLEGLRNGLSNDAIAAEMKLSPGYVRVALSELFEQLGVNNRTAAVMRGISIGLLLAPKPDPRDPDPTRQKTFSLRLKR